MTGASGATSLMAGNSSGRRQDGGGEEVGFSVVA
jgi:hypothetical protein